MKKLFIILLLPIIVSFDRDKEPPSKFYYKDNNNIHLWAFDNNDTAIYIRSEIHDIFNIKAESKKYQIFYDKKFTLLAVEIDVNKKDKSQYYRRYSRQGKLLMSFTKSNNKDIGVNSRFYYSGKIKSRGHFDDKGNSKGDTTWNEAGTITTINFKYDSTHSKSQDFYSNGKIKSETFEGSWQAETRFIIDYDSINGKPSYFLTRDTSIASITDQAEEIITTYFRKTPIDSVVVKKKK